VIGDRLLPRLENRGDLTGEDVQEQVVGTLALGGRGVDEVASEDEHHERRGAQVHDEKELRRPIWDGQPVRGAIVAEHHGYHDVGRRSV
jgi:hypothetical protein